MPRYSRGKHAIGICQRTGFEVPYQRLRQEWNGLLVDSEVWEEKHPQLTPPRFLDDAEALRRPSPPVGDEGNDSYPTWSSYTATTQLYELVSMTFGGPT